jgi:hypothetical protein
VRCLAATVSDELRPNGDRGSERCGPGTARHHAPFALSLSKCAALRRRSPTAQTETGSARLRGEHRSPPRSVRTELVEVRCHAATVFDGSDRNGGRQGCGVSTARHHAPFALSLSKCAALRRRSSTSSDRTEIGEALWARHRSPPCSVRTELVEVRCHAATVFDGRAYSPTTTPRWPRAPWPRS